MAVQNITKYRQLDGREILKVDFKPTSKYPNGVTYIDACFEELIRNYKWGLSNDYVKVTIGSYNKSSIQLHKEIMKLIHGHEIICTDHISGLKIDNIASNLNAVSPSQNSRNQQKRGYTLNQIYGSEVLYFRLECVLDGKRIKSSGVRREDEACLLQFQYENEIFPDYNYNFFLDRRQDADIVALERTGQISNEAATYLHIKRYVENNPWYIFRYNLFEYCKHNSIIIPKYYLNEQGRMVDVNGKILCPIKNNKEGKK